ncbi:hypothetical protein [Acidithiobacillus sp.]
MGVSLLLDTHVLLWAAMEPQKLSAPILELLENPKTSLLVSADVALDLFGINRRW